MPTIFVSVASYKDEHLFFTLDSAYSTADSPESLRFAIVDQSQEDQKSKVNNLPYSSQISYVYIKDRDSLGVCWARNIAFSLYDGEDYLLQIDSHMCFEEGWDTLLKAWIDKLSKLSPLPIVTGYPLPFRFVDGEPNTSEQHKGMVGVSRPVKECKLAEDDKVLRFGTSFIPSTTPVLGFNISAGFLFCSGKFVEDVPYDPYIYFHGEEQSLSIRAFTRGWDIFHIPVIPLYHLYKEAGVNYSSHHWSPQSAQNRTIDWVKLHDRSKLRINKLMTGRLTGAYGLGNLRTLKGYAEYSGIDYLNNTIEPRLGLP